MKRVLVTGANRGIGLEHVRRFAARGIEVIAAVRVPKQATMLHQLQREYAGLITIFPYDASITESIKSLKTAVGHLAIDLLFANAGALGEDEPLGQLETKMILDIVQINAIAPLKLAEIFIDNVAKSERKLIAFQSSVMGSIGSNSSGGYYAYRSSKAMLNMFAKNLSIDLRPKGISVLTLHPGWVRTSMGGEDAPLAPSESAVNQQKLFDQYDHSISGSFFNYDGQTIVW